MNSFSQIATILLGLLTGAMVLMAFGLVPYWRSLDPEEFTQIFTTSIRTVGRTMVILTILSTSTIVLVAGLALWKKLPSRNWIIFGALATLIVLATVPIYFGTANALLASGELSPLEITSELKTWQQMHMFRTIVGILGLFCAIRSGYIQFNTA